MFIREKIKSNKGYKKKFVYHQLVESYRTENGPRQRVLLDMDRLNIPKTQWKILANRIEEILIGQKTIMQVEAEIQSLAEHYSSLLINKRIDAQEEIEKQDQEFDEIDINSLKTSNLRTIGGEHISYEMLCKLQFDTILNALGFNDKQRKIALLLIIGRMLYPASELATYNWAKNISAIAELLNLNIKQISHNFLYRVSDKLIEHQDEIEKHLSERERVLFDLNENIILYDLTNTYFESSKTSDFKKYGRSKEKRYDQPLVTLGLVVDEDGFPKHSHLFEGNVSEAGTFEKIVKKFSTHGNFSNTKTFIMDAGISTEDNLKLIKSEGHEYIVVARNKPLPKEPTEGLITIRHSQQGTVEAKMIKQDGETILFCKSSLKSRKEESMRTRFSERFEKDLQFAKDGLQKKRGTKKYDKVLERIGRLKQKHSSIAYLYEINVKHHKGIVNDITWNIKDIKKVDERFSGGYYLRSSRTDLSEKEIWNLYISLTDVEDSFRSMKSYLGLRPNFHQKDERIKGHMFITVLAHHAVNSIQTLLHKKNVYMQWNTIRELLGVQQRVTTEMKNREGKKRWLRHTSEPESFHLLMANALSVKSKPMGVKKWKT